MGHFKDVKEEILKNGPSTKKTFSEAMFNKLSTAMLNDPEYERTTVSVKDGTLVEETTTPIKDLRKQLIGSVAKAAGCDAAEQTKIIDEHKFPELSMYPYVDSVLQEYTDPALGKRYVFGRKDNFQASLEMVEKEACIKDVKAPGAETSKKQRQGAYVKAVVKSTCPENLREDL